GAFQLTIFAEMNDVLDESLALVVARMSFASEDELDGPVFVVNKFHDILKLLEDQRGAFVSGESPGETDRECIHAEKLIESDEITLKMAALLQKQAAPGKFDQLTAETITKSPDFLIGNKSGVLHSFPEFRIVNLIFPIVPVLAMPEPGGVASSVRGIFLCLG